MVAGKKSIDAAENCKRSLLHKKSVAQMFSHGHKHERTVCTTGVTAVFCQHPPAATVVTAVRRQTDEGQRRL